MPEEKKVFEQPRLVEVVCPLCNRTYTLKVEFQDLVDFQLKGKFVQDAFPYLSPADRELLISGTCDPCFQKLFPPEKE